MKNSIKEEFIKQDENNLVEEHLSCRNCDFPVTADDIICPACGVDLKKDYKLLKEDEKANQKLFCVNCGRLLYEGDINCRICGTKIKKDYELKKEALEKQKLALEQQKLKSTTLEETICCKKCGRKLIFTKDVALCCGSYIVREEPVLIIDGNFKKTILYKYRKYNQFEEILDKAFNIISGKSTEKTIGDKVLEFKNYFIESYKNFQGDREQETSLMNLLGNHVSFIPETRTINFDTPIEYDVAKMSKIITIVSIFISVLSLLVVFAALFPKFGDLFLFFREPAKNIAFYLGNLNASFFNFILGSNITIEEGLNYSKILSVIFIFFYSFIISKIKNTKYNISWIVWPFLIYCSILLFVYFLITLP